VLEKKVQGRNLDRTGGRRKRHKEKLCNLYTVPKGTRLIRLRFKLAGHVVRTREMKNVNQILAWKPEEHLVNFHSISQFSVVKGFALGIKLFANEVG
jgi:hypothetical protein